ncbi:chemotaxis protein CheW [Vibrio sp. 10N.261.55.A7]|uniref:chemotaxis protein CheW n=1 Tax=Vibrio sp. 10N.261.55.A7 TaxID=1880851 RepID=UPI000CBB23FF|nr:chemotaxis protein CheW [Vibrio sp. 10N.261.55.A7]PMK00839.1 chemotaxis protein CheW [Vibrio sp. 10N.261.55.A7]
MSSQTMISSEQALDDYFTSLLDDVETQEPELEAVDIDTIAAQEEAFDSAELEPKFELTEAPQPEKSFYKLHGDEIVLPNLDDVERLLQQMETSNPVAELDLEEIIEQNTIQIAEEKNAQQIEEEIQDWTVDEPLLEEQVIESTLTEDVALQDEVVAKKFVTEEPILDEPAIQEPEIHVDVEIDTELATQSGDSKQNEWQSTKRDEDFQVLYFDVNGVVFAVPLDELGGIHRLGEVSHLIGRPSWYLGLQTSKDNQLDVVDTAKWVMPEKLADDSHKEQYQYIVMLGESMWGLASTELKGTELLNTEKVRWRETAGKRPWLAGMVKEKMCALIHVEALIAMLKAGLDVKALDK